MAKMVLSNAKKPTLLSKKSSYLQGLVFRLFTSVAGGTITGNTQRTDFTEPSDSGYPSTGLTTTWSGASLVGSQGQMTGTPISVTFNYNNNTPFTIQGYFVVDPADQVLVFSQFTAPLTVSGPGQTYTLNPVFLEDSIQ